MLIGVIQPTDTQTADFEGTSLAHLSEQANAATPAGFELTSLPVRMRKGSTIVDATATYMKREPLREIEADDQTALEQRVPDGWQLVSVQSL